MPVKKSQLDLCSTCGKPISGPSHKVPTKDGKVMTFHTDAMGCANAPDVKHPRISVTNENANAFSNSRYRGDYND